MSSFTEHLTVTQISGGLWRTEREFDYFVVEENSKDKITVPKSFLTDFASVPWPASMLIPKSGLYNQAAVLHDFLYATQTRSQKEADKIFLEAMKILGVNPIKRWLMYRAVRLWGFIPWDMHRRKNRMKFKP